MANLINGRAPEDIKAGLKSCTTGKTPGYGCNISCPYLNTPNCWLPVKRDALAYIEHLEAQQPKWISVEEQLPDKAGKYIVCTRKKAVYCTAFRFSHDTGYFATDTTTHITHWMPLPEPPKGEEE